MDKLINVVVLTENDTDIDKLINVAVLSGKKQQYNAEYGWLKML